MYAHFKIALYVARLMPKSGELFQRQPPLGKAFHNVLRASHKAFGTFLKPLVI